MIIIVIIYDNYNTKQAIRKCLVILAFIGVVNQDSQLVYILKSEHGSKHCVHFECEHNYIS